MSCYEPKHANYRLRILVFGNLDYNRNLYSHDQVQIYSYEQVIAFLVRYFLFQEKVNWQVQDLIRKERLCRLHLRANLLFPETQAKAREGETLVATARGAAETLSRKATLPA